MNENIEICMCNL